MNTITYIHPTRETFLATVQYKSGENKSFEYVVGAYKKEKYITTLIDVNGDDIVDILDDIYCKITFGKNKKEL